MPTTILHALAALLHESSGLGTAGLLALACAQGAAQAPARPKGANRTSPWVVELTLASDPARSGPPAWTWVRDEHLRPQCEAAGIDPLAPLALAWDPDGLRVETIPEPPPAGCYVTGHARLGAYRVWIAGDADGSEDWLVEGAPDDPRIHPANFLALRPGVQRCFDVGTLLAAFARPGGFDDPRTLLFAAAGAACGETEVACSLADDGALRIRGQGGGGLVLPAALLALARADGSDVGSWIAPAPPNAREHWLLMARAARGAYREEALRQLTLVDGPQAEATLRRALLADSWDRVVAMRALADRIALGKTAPGQLEAVASAADPAQPGAEEAARVAVARLWSATDLDVRQRLRARAAGLIPRPAEPPRPPAPEIAARADWRTAAWVWLVASTAGIAFWRRSNR